MSHIWDHKGLTASDKTHHLFYHGAEMQKAHYRSDLIWEKAQGFDPGKFYIRAHNWLDIYLTGSNIVIDWGDGTVEAPGRLSSTWATHDFSDPDAEYIVSIKGDITTMQLGHITNTGGYSIGLLEVLTPLPRSFALRSCASLFQYCTNLTAIPADLFHNLADTVTSFRYAFVNCKSLMSIPEGLFDKCTKVTTFYGCFTMCTSLTGYAPALWTRTDPAPTGTACFRSCTKLANYSSIPSGWK